MNRQVIGLIEKITRELMEEPPATGYDSAMKTQATFMRLFKEQIQTLIKSKDFI